MKLDPLKDKSWPKSARSLWKTIKPVLPLLESHEIRAERREEGRDRVKRRVIVLERMAADPDKAPVKEDSLKEEAGSINDLAGSFEGKGMTP